MHPQWNWSDHFIIFHPDSLKLLQWPFRAFQPLWGFLGWIQFPPWEPAPKLRPGSAPYELLTTGKLREDWEKWVGHQDGRLWGRCYTWDPQVCLRLRKENGTPYVRQNLGWGNMSLMWGRSILSTPTPTKRDEHDGKHKPVWWCKGVHSSEIFLELFLFCV